MSEHSDSYGLPKTNALLAKWLPRILSTREARDGRLAHMMTDGDWIDVSQVWDAKMPTQMCLGHQVPGGVEIRPPFPETVLACEYADRDEVTIFGFEVITREAHFTRTNAVLVESFEKIKAALSGEVDLYSGEPEDRRLHAVGPISNPYPDEAANFLAVDMFELSARGITTFHMEHARILADKDWKLLNAQALGKKTARTLYDLACTLRLLNVRNVRAQPTSRRPISRQAVRALKRMGVREIGPIRHHTLTVTVPPGTRDENGNLMPTGIGLPLHKVRGHFADYTARPLFGRYRGVFWVPAHLRGNPTMGVVTKDYHIEPPERAT